MHMNATAKHFTYLIAFWLLSSFLGALESYQVYIEGNFPESMRGLFESASQLVSLQNNPPATFTGLKGRAEADIPNFLKVLHSQAYFGPIIKLKYNVEVPVPIVTVVIDAGPVYPLANVTVESDNGDYSFPFETISAQDIKLQIGFPAYPKAIFAAEEELLHLLTLWGYPLAKIVKRDVVADQSCKAINVCFYVDTGPAAFFGATTIIGNRCVKEAFFQKKLDWCQGELYSPLKIERTQMALEASGLFSSIIVRHAEEISPDNQLPMIVEVTEGKPRSIGWGLAYNTVRKVGVTFEWAHRNIRGLGERLSFDADIWKDDIEAHLLYVKPDFGRPRQDLLWLAEVQHERTKGYSESSLSLSGIIERQINDLTRISYGLMYKWLRDTHSRKNGIFNLLKIPMYIRWSNANDPLDPTRGSTVHLRFIPTLEVVHPQFFYNITTLTFSHYQPLSCDEKWVLASRLIVGSIWGSESIPASEKFYEGSDSVLRGYGYQTVSPLKRGKPKGGRSVLVYTAELRVRATDTWGWVAFYDIGNVYPDTIPVIDRKQFQSVGAGIRYFTPVGPLRLDLAVPLQRRRHLDPRFQIYLSIGQAF